MGKRYFGTDGIRGRVGQHPITAEFVLKLGWAVGRVLQTQGFNKVLIGKDTRISGYMFESALEAGLSASGVNIALLGPMPTPGIAYLTRTLHACAGIVVSASHNPYYDNGIKFFSRDGQKLPDAVEMRIEDLLEQPMTTVEPDALGKAERIVDAAGRYIEFCKSTVPAYTSLAGIKIVVDCAHGATYHIAPSVLSEMGATVISIGAAPDGLNINLDCGSTKPAMLLATVKEQGADLGIAFDGDGDRVIMVDHRGEVLDGDELLFIIARDRLRTGSRFNAVVGTLMTNLGLEVALRALGLELRRAKVGDRYVMECLQAEKLILGGEGSGHIICLDRTTTGDGIISALQVLSAMLQSGKSLHDLKAGISKYPQMLINVSVTGPVDLQRKLIQEAVRAVEIQLGDNGRVLLRASGTEPVVRVMVEGVDMGTVERHARELANVVRDTLSV
ncbi:MAG: phosphoglucosamine mutase [Candidatus Competibacteraceae bacterium]|uniref:Phosphoglucosamine mutase n=1 Tax=Candidatus Contendobacter odensis Run_B_J11 TaxID=1400861 RepID=A0A7U7G869_9GAMM|nr:phosphoglucosamine mutase [Candidatus Contendobacter odensis]MBK8537465.1 phosphoglucosamine mutase [Candidatus Competibacteraceae bacterium]MBK8751553.1 phosphoglucosamine mutase [Candidatus Competibacteraceae bacterium]CDH43498.1 phosphoglucosamine mutase [Candidatus Contendobacter odensis Run_B_J11]